MSNTIHSRHVVTIFFSKMGLDFFNCEKTKLLNVWNALRNILYGIKEKKIAHDSGNDVFPFVTTKLDLVLYS